MTQSLVLPLHMQIPIKTYTLSGKNSSGKSDEKFHRRKFSPTNKVIKELLSNTKDIEVVVIDDE